MRSTTARVPERKQAQAAYEAFTNTFGHEVHVIEMRPKGSKDNDAWTPETERGNYFLGYCKVHCHYRKHLVVWPLYGYSTGKEAANIVKELNYWNSSIWAYRIKRYKMPQHIAEEHEANNQWKKHEAEKLANGTYTPLPFANEPWFKARHEELNHFAHVALTDPGKVAYTRNVTDGRNDRQAKMTVGRYLNEYYHHQLAAEPPKETGATNVHGEKTRIRAMEWYARQFQNVYGGKDELCFATTAADMVEVYLNGPDSCMAHYTDDYMSAPHHPVEVYAAGDLHLAYLKASDGHITARALVWPKKKAVGRIYGDEIALSIALAEQGYAPQDAFSLRGAKLLKIKHGKGYVMPYIDGPGSYGQHAEDAYFCIGGSKAAGWTNGLDHDPEDECNRCGGSAYESVSVYINHYGDYEDWCANCQENHSFYCDETGNHYANRVPHIELANGAYVARHAAGNSYFPCAIDRIWYATEDRAGLFEDTGEMVSQSTVDREGLKADAHGIYWRPENMPTEAEQQQEAA